MGQHLKGHVLEGTGGAAPQLQTVGIAVQGPHRGHRRRVKLLRAVGALAKSVSSFTENSSRNSFIT